MGEVGSRECRARLILTVTCDLLPNGLSGWQARQGESDLYKQLKSYRVFDHGPTEAKLEKKRAACAIHEQNKMRKVIEEDEGATRSPSPPPMSTTMMTMMMMMMMTTMTMTMTMMTMTMMMTAEEAPA